MDERNDRTFAEVAAATAAWLAVDEEKDRRLLSAERGFVACLVPDEPEPPDAAAERFARETAALMRACFACGVWYARRLDRLVRGG